MLTSPRANVADSFVPGHHLALITQPVLGARSRSRKKTNIIVETSTSSKEKLDSMTNSRRSSYNDSPPLILPINRIDTSQYQKKKNSNTHHESSDSGLDLSLSTNSSVQFQQYSQQHLQNHRPLSALNEDSSLDDGYHDEHQQVSMDAVRLRCPPINFGRNRSMEDMISNNKCEEQQHRSSSFSDETHQKLPSHQERKLKRSSDGALLDLIDGSSESTESYRRTILMKNELFYPINTQQHQSLNDLTNQTYSKVTRNELNVSMIDNNSSTTHSVIRKPNIPVPKSSRKKTKLNVLIEPSGPLASSRLTIYDAQANTMTGANSSSSNQTTPRSVHPLGQQQQVKLKSKTQLSHYPNPEQIRAHVNRSVLERQHPTNLVVPTGRGAIQQILPFDASPSKFNNLLLRHYVQQHQANAAYHSSSNAQLSPSRQVKQTLKALYTEENIANYQDEKRKQKEQIKIRKFKEYEEKQRFKQKENFENPLSNDIYEKQYGKSQMKDTRGSIPFKSVHKREKSQDTFEQVITQRYQIGSIQRPQEKETSYEKNQQRNRFMKNRLPDESESTDERQHMENVLTITPRRQYEQQNDSHSRGSFINDSNRNSIVDKHESIQSNNNTTTGNVQSTNFMHRRQQKPLEYVDDSLHVNQSNNIHRDICAKQQHYGSKPPTICLRNKTHNYPIEKGLIQTTESNSQYRSDYLHGSKKKTLVPSQSRPLKVHFPSYENPTNNFSLIEIQTDQNQYQHKWRNSTYENDSYSLQKFQNRSTSKMTQIQGVFPKNENVHELKREKQISQMNYVPKEDLRQYNETKFDQKPIEKNSTESFQIRSPISSSIISVCHNDRQNRETYEKTNVYESTLAASPLFHEELIEDNSKIYSHDYPIAHDDKKQILNGKYVIPSNNFDTPTIIDRSSHPSSCHTYPFSCTNDVENNNDNLTNDYSMATKNKNYKSIETDIYVLSEHDSANNTIEVRNPSSHSEKFSSNKKMYSPSEKVELSIEKEEILSNYDSDDGWSDDSAELLYVDERYAMEKRKITSSSHLSSEEPYQYQVQQQNVLLQ